MWHLLHDPKYNGKDLHEQIKMKLPEDIKVADTLANIVVPTFDVKNMQAVIFSSFEAQQDALKNPPLANVCIGTSAAPTYFPPISFTTKNDAGQSQEFNLIDGGVVANNPTMVAMSMLNKEALRIRQKWTTAEPNGTHKDSPRGDTKAALLALSRETVEENKGKQHMVPIPYENFIVISIGTGSAKRDKQYTAEDVAGWGQVKWISNSHGASIIDVFTRGSSDIVDMYTAVRFKDIGCEKNYLRIQVRIASVHKQHNQRTACLHIN